MKRIRKERGGGDEAEGEMQLRLSLRRDNNMQ